MDFLIFLLNCNCLRWYAIGDNDPLASRSVCLRIIYELFLNCKQLRNSMKLLKESQMKFVDHMISTKFMCKILTIVIISSAPVHCFFTTLKSHKVVIDERWLHLQHHFLHL